MAEAPPTIFLVYIFSSCTENVFIAHEDKENNILLNSYLTTIITPSTIADQSEVESFHLWFAKLCMLSMSNGSEYIFSLTDIELIQQCKIVPWGKTLHLTLVITR